MPVAEVDARADAGHTGVAGLDRAAFHRRTAADLCEPVPDDVEVLNVEYERRATKASTWAVSTSFVPGRDADYRNVGAFWHYYPAGRALHGFYLGGRVQVHHGSALTESATLGGVGFELGKNWIIGRRTLVGLGVGATRLFGGPLAGDSLTLPTFRIANVGITFQSSRIEDRGKRIHGRTRRMPR